METDVTASPRSVYTRLGKPLLDRLAGLVLALITLPVLVVLLVMALAAFGWPPLLRTSRIGRNDTRFNLYRINTRKDYQTDLRGRNLRFSLWLRRTSLDELPQLWNVALGHMSLVGPRPRIAAVYEKIVKLGYHALAYLRGVQTRAHQLPLGPPTSRESR